MARIRTIKPAFFTDAEMADLPLSARLTFIGLWTHVDDSGRAVDDPRLVKAALWPLDDKHTAKKVDADLAALAKIGRIYRYEAKGKRYLEVVNWAKHQKISHPQPSAIPPPSFTERSGNDPGTEPERSGPDFDFDLEVEVERDSSSTTVSASQSAEIASEEDRNWPPEDTTDPDLVRYRDACRLLAERRLKARTGPAVVDAAAWVETATRRLWVEKFEKASTVLSLHGAISPEELADRLEPPPVGNQPKAFEPPDEPEFDPEAGKAMVAAVRAGRL